MFSLEGELAAKAWSAKAQGFLGADGYGASVDLSRVIKQGDEVSYGIAMHLGTTRNEWLPDGTRPALADRTAYRASIGPSIMLRGVTASSQFGIYTSGRETLQIIGTRISANGRLTSVRIPGQPDGGEDAGVRPRADRVPAAGRAGAAGGLGAPGRRLRGQSRRQQPPHRLARRPAGRRSAGLRGAVHAWAAATRSPGERFGRGRKQKPPEARHVADRGVLSPAGIDSYGSVSPRVATESISLPRSVR